MCCALSILQRSSNLKLFVPPFYHLWAGLEVLNLCSGRLCSDVSTANIVCRLPGIGDPLPYVATS